MKRRTFLGTTAGTLAASAAGPLRSRSSVFAETPNGTGQRPARILLRSSWQVVNIGDIAHTPGVLALLERYIPEAEVVLWASGGIHSSASSDCAQCM